MISDSGAAIILILLGYLYGSNVTQFSINILFTKKPGLYNSGSLTSSRLLWGTAALKSIDNNDFSFIYNIWPLHSLLQ